jgi:putative DNA methylase
VYTGELANGGEQEVLRPDVALDLARERVASLKKRGLLAGREVDFDRVTDWYLLAWNDFQAVEFPFDEARKLSIALHLDVDDLKQRHKVVRASSGTVTLLTPAERRTADALDADASSWETQLDALHALMLVYDEDGLGAAQAWLDRTGRRDDQRFIALIEAALNAIPRVRKNDEMTRAGGAGTGEHAPDPFPLDRASAGSDTSG